MTEIQPFSALAYNPEKIPELSRVVCPPYDVISPSQQEGYLNAGEYNFIRVLLNKDVPGEDKYKKAGQTFRDWQKSKVLVRDPGQAIYFSSQRYKVRGETRNRLGFICLLRLGESNSGVFGHEHTRKEPKEDRARIIRAVKANLSPIFVVLQDQKRIIQRVWQQHVSNRPPDMEATDDDRTVHQLWRIDKPEVIALMQAAMKEENMFIADGHHRYEVACGYRDEMRASSANYSGTESYNYVMTYFTNTGSNGLLVMPIHRLVSVGENLGIDALAARLEEYFQVEEVRDRKRFFFLMEKGGMSEHVLGAYREKKFLLLRLKNVKMLDTLIADKPKEYRCLDVSILNHIVFDRVLGMNPVDKELITFTPHTDELIARVDTDPGALAFFLNPVKIEQITAVALKGEKMPPKSTYFYPKVISGMVVHSFDR